MDPTALDNEAWSIWASLKGIPGMEDMHMSNLPTPAATSPSTSSEQTSSPPSTSSTTTTTGTSSLDILRPRPWVPSADDLAAASALGTAPPRSEGPTAEMLEDLSKQLIQCYCTQDWSNPLLETIGTPNFTACVDHVDNRLRTWDEHIQYYKKLHQTHPNYTYEVEKVSADVDEEKGLASVWVLLCVTGYPAHIRRESLTVLGWRRRKGKWRCYKQLGIRGVNWFDD